MDQPGQSRPPVRVSPLGDPATISIDHFKLSAGGTFSPLSDELQLGIDKKTGDRAPYARGRLFLSADVSDGGEPAHDFILAEVNVIGWMGSTKDVFGRFAFGEGRQEQTLVFEHPYDKITFEARQVVNGSGNSDVVPLSLGFFAVARVWR